MGTIEWLKELWKTIAIWRKEEQLPEHPEHWAETLRRLDSEESELPLPTKNDEETGATGEVIHVESLSDWNFYIERAKDISPIEEFLESEEAAVNDFRFCRTALKKVQMDIDKITAPKAFDDGVSEKLAEKMQKLAEKLIDSLQTCLRKKDSASYQRLADAIETYMQHLGVSIKPFRLADSVDDWHDLAMEDSVIPQPTHEKRLHNTFCDIEVQPHVLRYDDDGETGVLYFGGRCSVYIYQEE